MFTNVILDDRMKKKEVSKMALIKCPECGKETSNQAERCVHCGYPIEKLGNSVYDQLQDVPSIGLNILSFCIPIVGLILYCVHQSKTPKKASAIGKSALIGFIIGLVLIMFL